MKQTPLFAEHEKQGGKIIDFGGWALPVQYGGILGEHESVRTAAGLFDVSHMGEIDVSGEGAVAFLQNLVTGNVEKLADSQVLYTLMCNEDGGVVDDLLVYRYSTSHYLLVVNASNTDKDFDWITKHVFGDVEAVNISSRVAQLAIQGPKAEQILQRLTAAPLSDIGFYRFVPETLVAGARALVSRTGYTGEDGFEIYTDASDAVRVWNALLDVGRADSLVPVGLGARDTLRFESALPLYGHELGDTISPLEANLGFFVKFDKGDFIGRAALLSQKESGIPRELIGLEMIDRGIARNGCEVMANGAVIGFVTTGSFSPTLKKNIALALVTRGIIKEGDELRVIVRDKPLTAKRVTLPFYKKRYRR